MEFGLERVGIKDLILLLDSFVNCLFSVFALLFCKFIKPRPRSFSV